jgi:hypothetical protein
MTLQDFSRDIIPIIQACIAFVGLGMLGVVWWQVRQAANWNKLKAAQAFIHHTTNVYESDVINTAAKHNLQLKARTTPLTEDEVNLIWDKTDLYLAVLTILNDTESTCAAINAGIVDWELAFSVHSARFTQAFGLYQPFIKRIRRHHDDPSIYIEFEKTVNRIKTQTNKHSEVQLRNAGVSVRA